MQATSVPASTPDLLRLRSEFLSMPGLCLDARQTARLLSVNESEARVLLEALVDERLLRRLLGGRYQLARMTAFAPPAV